MTEPSALFMKTPNGSVSSTVHKSGSEMAYPAVSLG